MNKLIQINDNQKLIIIEKDLYDEYKKKINYYDFFIKNDLLTNFRDTAKQFKISQKNFINCLLKLGYIYRDKKGILKPYQIYVKKGLFELKEYYNEYTKSYNMQTLITIKGREEFKNIFVKNLNL